MDEQRTEAPWQSFGSYAFRVEPPDVFVSRVSGDLGAEDQARILDEVNRFGEGLPAAFWLADISRLGHVTPGARKVSAERTSSLRVRAVAISGASFTHRVLITLISQAARLIDPSPSAPIFAVFSGENEARAWLSKQRTLAAQQHADERRPHKA